MAAEGAGFRRSAALKSGGKVLLGVGMGLGAGYLAVRSCEAFLQWRHPAPPVPKDAAAYARMRRALEVLGTVRGTAGFMAFAYGPLAVRADRATRRLPVWARPACYHAALSLASAITELPVSFIEEYSLERRFGLSDQSRRSWLGDYAKGATISAALSALLATLFGFALRRAPRRWP